MKESMIRTKISKLNEPEFKSNLEVIQFGEPPVS